MPDPQIAVQNDLCACCHMAVPPEELFRRASNTRTGSAGRICISCCIGRRHAHRRTIFFLYGGLVALAIVLLTIAPESPVGWRLADSGFFLLVMFVLAVMHLLAQAGVGALLGLRPGNGAIGYGTSLWHIQMGTFSLDLKAMPVCSALLLVGTSERYYRVRQFIAMLAGPLCTLGMFLLFLWMFEYRSQRTVDAFIGLNWDAYLPRATFVLLVLNLWPRKMRLMEGRDIMTDGMCLRRLPFLSREAVWDEIRDAYMTISFAWLTQGRESEALEITREGLRKMPDDFWLQYRLMGVYADCGDFETYRTLAERLRDRPDAGRWGLAHVQCDMAYYGFFFQREEYLEEADAVSRAFYRAYPRYPYFIGVRGTVLVWQGRVEDGERLIQQAMELHGSPVAKADLCCVLATMEQSRGNAGKAENYMRRARKLSPRNVFLRKLDEGSFVRSGSVTS